MHLDIASHMAPGGGNSRVQARRRGQENENENENVDQVPVVLKRGQRRLIRWRLHLEGLESVSKYGKRRHPLKGSPFPRIGVCRPNQLFSVRSGFEVHRS